MSYDPHQHVQINGIWFSGEMLLALFNMVTNPDPSASYRFEKVHGHIIVHKETHQALNPSSEPTTK